MRLCVYAHFNESGSVAQHVLHFLRQLRAMEFQIWFVSNSPIAPTQACTVQRECEKVIERDNEGLDFGMWQDALVGGDLHGITELLLTNSSVIGPLCPLEDVWDNPRVNAYDFWGLTDNSDIEHHLQSYFLVFNRRVLHSPAFLRFWSAVLPYHNKSQIIRSYEVGLTCWLQQHGFRWGAIFEQTSVLRHFLQSRPLGKKIVDRIRRRPLPELDTTLFYPQILLQMGMPFLKASLLKPGNPYLTREAALRMLDSTELPREVIRDLARSHSESGSYCPPRGVCNTDTDG